MGLELLSLPSAILMEELTSETELSMRVAQRRGCRRGYVKGTCTVASGNFGQEVRCEELGAKI